MRTTTRMTTAATMTTLRPELRTARRTWVSVQPAAGRVALRSETTGDPARPSLRPMLLESGPAHARVCLVPDGALLLAGDAVALDVVVGPGVRLDLVEPAGTVAYDMRGGTARWDVTLELGDDATLTWGGEPFVLAAGSSVERSTTIRLGDRARVALRETVVLGRHHERPGQLRNHWYAGDAGGDLLVEDLVLDGTAHRPGVLGGHRVLGSVVALGIDVSSEVCPAGRLDLDRGGTVWRRLAAEAHRAVPMEAWHAALAGC